MGLNMKKYKIYRIIVSMFLIISLFANTHFAAIVSDNDGSAFITKSEFEALKTDFANQITSYNNSIDSKIDGAIAAYLAAMAKKKIPQTNHYTDIEKNKKLKWVSATDYVNTSNNGKPEYDVTHTERYLQGSVVWHAVVTRAGRISQGQWAFDEIYCCNHDKTDSSKVYVESLRDIVPKFTFTDQYVFSAYSGLTTSTNSYEMMGRSPDNYITGISLTNTVVVKEYHGSGNLDPAQNRVHENYHNNGGARYIHEVASYSANTTNTYDYLTLAPKSNSNTYYYLLDCEDKCTDTTMFNRHYNGSDLPGWSVNVTNNTNALTVSGTTINYPTLNVKALSTWSNQYTITSTDNVTWWRKQIVQKNLRYELINTATSEDNPIHKGILLTTISNEGTLTFKLHSDFAGKLVLYRGSAPIDNLADSTAEGVIRYDIGTSATNPKTIELKDCQKNDKIYMVYLPTDTTKKATLKFDEEITIIPE